MYIFFIGLFFAFESYLQPFGFTNDRFAIPIEYDL